MSQAMTAQQLLEIFNRYRKDNPVMASSGRTRAIFRQMGHRDPAMYDTGMSSTSPACFGLALARPDLKVIAIEGDGAMLMGLANLATIGRYLPKNLVILVINNRTYLSTDRGELESATAVRADLGSFARAAGIDRTMVADTLEEFEEIIHQAMLEEGPFVIIANVDRTQMPESPSEKEVPDRTELSIAFRRYLSDGRPSPAKERKLSSRLDSTEALQSPGRGREAARILYNALKESGIDFFVYLPDSILYPVQEIAERDPDMMTICCTREDEGVAIASGATYGGRFPVVVMEGTGVGLSGLILAASIVRRIPLLIISSHSESLGIRAPHNDIACMVNEPILRALNIHYAVLTHLRDASLIIRESQRSARVLKNPVAVVVPPYVMDETLS
jgi:thiamine pyrophosphate-dependent acetolactate synthase large subunit-like protein